MNTCPISPSPTKRPSTEWDHVIYLEGSRNYTTFVFADGKTRLTSKSIGVYESLLPEHFVRVHKGSIVNRHFVIGLDSITKSIVLANKNKIKIARRRWFDLKEIFLAGS